MEVKPVGDWLTGAQAVVECIRREEINHVFCVPGESYLEVMDAIYDVDGMELISTRHEGGAAFMAEAYAKATGKPGIAMATRGVGGSNLAIGIHTAHQDSTPMVVFLGQVDSKFRGREGFQEVELDRFFGHICKWAVEIRDVERIPEIVQRAFRIAKSGRPGPVVVALPADIIKQQAEMKFAPIAVKPKPKPSCSEVDACFDLLSKAQRPLILAGGGIISSNGEDTLERFADQYGIPVIASFRRHDVFAHNHPLFAGHSGLGTFAGILDTIRQADTILAIGTRFSEVTTQGYSIISDRQKIIHIDIDDTTLGKVYPPELGIIADAKEALLALLQAKYDLPVKRWTSWASERRRVYEQLVQIEESHHNDHVDVKQIMVAMQKVLPKDTIITNDAGNFSGWLHSFYSFNERKTYIGPTSGAMGYGVPAAIGAKIAHPHRTVVSLSGDGGFMMTMQELETAVRYQVPIVSLVFNNNMYGTIRMHQEKEHPLRVIGTDLGNPDFTLLAQAFGLHSERVTADADFEGALVRAVQSNKPALIEIMCDPEKISVQATISSLREKALQAK
jgi:acetolactate synthase I/II/III large subunit